jgi:uncharacterized protein YcbK (DUF882 family)
MPIFRSVVSLVLTLLPATALAAPQTEAKSRDGTFAAPAAARSKPGSGASRLTRRHAPHPRQARAAKEAKPRECVKAPVEVLAGSESATFSLARCDGSAAPGGVDRLSTLARASGGHRLDPKLVERLELAVDHFRKGSEPVRVLLVSGYRPRSAGSYHSTGRALDVRIDGVENDALDAFCKTLPDTGCGFYPNSVFVHIDVRDPHTGHVAWTDVSRPGEPPRYVTQEPSRASTLPTLPGIGSDAGGPDQRLVVSAGKSPTVDRAAPRSADMPAGGDPAAASEPPPPAHGHGPAAGSDLAHSL